MTWTAFALWFCIAGPSPIELGDPEQVYFLAGKVEILEDPSGTLTLDDVLLRSQDFVLNYARVPSFGLTHSAFWLKFSVIDTTGKALRWILINHFPLTREVTFYVPTPAGYQAHASGYVIPKEQRSTFAHRYVVALPSNLLTPQTIFVRVQTSPALLDFTIESDEAFAAHSIGDNWVLGRFYGFALCMLLYNALLFLALRDKSYVYYIGYLLPLVYVTMVRDGIAQDFFNVANPLAEGTIFGLGVFAMGAFARTFLQTNTKNKMLDYVLLVVMATSAAVVVFTLFGLSILGFAINVVFCFLALTLFIAISYQRWRAGYLPARYFTWAWHALSIGAILVVMHDLGIVKPAVWNNYGLHLGAIINFVLLSLALTHRIQHMYVEKERAEREVLANREHFLQKLITSQDNERQRIAAELHDSLGQKLLVIKNVAYRAQQKPAPETFTSIAETAQSAVDEIRVIAYGLHPHTLERLGLWRALEALAEQMADSSGIAIAFAGPDVHCVLPKDQDVHVFRIVQEALNNAVRHANATTIAVSFSCTLTHCHINVTDNGCGLNASALANIQNGLGLGSLRERVSILKGTLTIQCPPKGGTQLIVEFPKVISDSLAETSGGSSISS